MRPSSPLTQETQMNRNFTPISARRRVISAAASVIATLAIVTAIEALAQHYQAESTLARTLPAVVAQR